MEKEGTENRITLAVGDRATLSLNRVRFHCSPVSLWVLLCRASRALP